jgi:Cu-Zn family superoxide dismutase
VCPGRGGTGSYDRHGRSRRADAFTYDDDLVPVGATASVQSVTTGSGQSIVTPIVHGLLPNHTYGAHAHVNACRSTGAAAGGHVEQSATGGANQENEIWLDFTTRC